MNWPQAIVVVPGRRWKYTYRDLEELKRPVKAPPGHQARPPQVRVHVAMRREPVVSKIKRMPGELSKPCVDLLAVVARFGSATVDEIFRELERLGYHDGREAIAVRVSNLFQRKFLTRTGRKPYQYQVAQKAAA